MYKPSMIGNSIIFDNPGISSFTTTDLTNTDSNSNNSDVYPYAKSASLKEHYDCQSFHIEDDSYTIQANMKNSFGVFLTPSEELSNLIFSLVGSIIIYTTENNMYITPFFGRTSGANVVSSKGSVQNLLSDKVILPMSVYADGTGRSKCVSIDTQIIAVYDSSANNFCFGFSVENPSGGAGIIQMHSTLSIRKYSSVIPINTPIGR